MDKKLLVLDIDGTLVNSKKEITPRTYEAIMKIQGMGHIVALASGRPYPGMKQFVKRLDMDKKGGYAIAFNGGMIVDCKTGKPVIEKCIPNRFIKGLYEYALDNNIGMVTYKDDMVITGTEIDNYMQYEARLNNMPLKKVKDFLAFVDYDMIKCLMTAEPNVKAPRCEMELKKMFAPGLNVFRSEPYFIEITTNGVDKSTTLPELLKLIGISREHTICCGDGFNDATMVKFAGIGVAMGNAQQIVKDSADYITGTCDEDGLVEVIERFIL